MFTSKFWKAYWIALRRMHRDPAALRLGLRVTAYFIYLAVYLGWIARGVLATHDGETYFILGFGAALGGGALLLVSIWNWKDAWLTRREAAKTVNVAVRDQLRLEAFAIAMLLHRASSEQMVQTKTLPPGIEVITRRSQLDRLRALGLMTSFPEHVRSLLLLPDGHWTPQQINASWFSVEALRCLRWVLCLDSALLSLGDVVDSNAKDLNTLLDKPERILKAQRLLDPWDIRVERNIADAVFSRCYVEQLSRGKIPAENEEQRSLALEIQEAAIDAPHEDYLVGSRTVIELSDDAARDLSMTAYRRHSCLLQIMDLLDGGGMGALRQAVYVKYE